MPLVPGRRYGVALFTLTFEIAVAPHPFTNYIQHRGRLESLPDLLSKQPYHCWWQ